VVAERGGARAILAALLLVGVGFGFYLSGNASAPGGRPAPVPQAPSAAPGPAPGRSTSTSAFPVAEARRLVTLLDSLERLAVSTEGRLVQGKAVAEEDRELLRPEPLTYGDRLRALPGYDDILGWIAEGGDMQALAPEEEELVEAIDARFHEAGLLPPLRVYLRARPSRTGGDVPPLNRAFRVGSLGPWGFAASLALRRALDATRVVEDQLYKNPEVALNMDLPDSFGVFQLAKARDILRSVGRTPHGRVRLAAFVRPVVEDVWLALVLAARSIRHEPETAETIAWAFAHAVDDCDPASYSELLSLTPRQLTGMRVTDPALGALVGEMNRNFVGRPALGPEQVEERMERAFQTLRVGCLPTGRPDARKRRDYAQARLARLAARNRREGELRRLWGELRPMLATDPPDLGRGPLYETADYLSGCRPGEDPERDAWAREVRDGLARWLTAYPKGDEAGGRGRRLLDRLSRVLAGQDSGPAGPGTDVPPGEGP
jgi:hypothetical protein